ncbi:MAG: DUF1501 domain-containing protein [Aquabacterium sp.]
MAWPRSPRNGPGLEARPSVVVLSEFGRTFRQNGNGGTDHGHGSVYWVLGGGLRGGRIVGDQAACDAGRAFPEPRLPRAQRLPRGAGGLADAPVWLECQSEPAGLRGRDPERPRLVVRPCQRSVTSRAASRACARVCAGACPGAVPSRRC